MRKITVALAGLGEIGSGLVELLEKDKILIQDNYRVDLELVAVAERDWRNGYLLSDRVQRYNDANELIGKADILVELIGGINFSYDLISNSLNNNMSVVTANKALLAKHGLDLANLAENRGVQLKYEASVAGGIPIIKSIKESVSLSEITKVSGILNGSTNHILTEMERTGETFEDVLKQAQSLGYVEADPSLDVDGIDASHKLNILGALCFAKFIPIESFKAVGIKHVTLNDIEFAKSIGKKIKLIGEISKSTDGKFIAMLEPMFIPADSIFANTDGSLNIVRIHSSSLETLTLQGHGAGKKPTSNAVLQDIIDIALHRDSLMYNRKSSAIQIVDDVKNDVKNNYIVKLRMPSNHDLSVKCYEFGGHYYEIVENISGEEIGDIFSDVMSYYALKDL